MVSAGYLVVAGAFGAVLLTTRTSGTSATPAGTPVELTSAEPAWETTTTSSSPATPTPTTSTPPSGQTPAGYRRVSTASGMTTVIPETWPVVPCESGNGCEQANDPADPGRYLRIGGSSSPSPPLETVQGNYEQQFSQRTGYQRLRFTTGTYHGYPSVEWEFEWTNSGVRRHVRAMYWRAGGNDNIAYASAPASSWDATLPLYQAMIDYSTP